MPQVKIILGTEYVDPWNTTILLDSITDWEEISDDELVFLRENIYRISTWPSGLYPTILVKDELPVSIRIESIREKIKEELSRKREQERKNEEANEKRIATKQKNKEEKEKKILEELKAKYGS
ncbi:MAG: hypothetical protein WC554_13505 [Clostridia bacterium]